MGIYKVMRLKGNIVHVVNYWCLLLGSISIVHYSNCRIN